VKENASTFHRMEHVNRLIIYTIIHDFKQIAGIVKTNNNVPVPVVFQWAFIPMTDSEHIVSFPQ